MTIARTLLRRRLIEARRYWVETIAVFALMYVIFLLIFLGARAFAGHRVGGSDELASIVVGYSLWVLIQQAYQHFATSISDDTSAGTLEQLALAPVGLARISIIDFLVQLVIETVRLVILVVAMMATTGRWLNIDVGALVMIGIPTLASVAGIGLAVAGVGLVHKRVSGVISLISVLFIAILLLPPDRFPVVRAFPVALANELLTEVLVGNQGARDVLGVRLGALVAIGATAFGLGAVSFGRMEQRARARGVLGQY